MGVLNNTKTYLGGPMEYDPNGASWRQDLTVFLNGRGIKVLDPYKNPLGSFVTEGGEAHNKVIKLRSEGKLWDVHTHMKSVRAQDLSLVDRSDFLIFYINPTTPTFGTIEEMVTAIRMKRPTFTVVEGGVERTPLWLLGMSPPKYFYNSFGELKTMLEDIDDGNIEIDNERWRLLIPDLR